MVSDNPKPRRPRRNEESVAQRGFFAEVFIRELSDWRWGLIFSIPNEGIRTIQNAGRMKAEGMRAGMPDVLCAIPIGKYTGLVIEFKSKTGTVSKNQAPMLTLFRKAGHAVYLARSAEEGIFITKKYLAGEL